jgi:hypothetical protein
MLGWVDHRNCKEFKTVDGVVVGTCEMKDGGGCLYVQGYFKLHDQVRGKEDRKDWWGEDYLGYGGK